MKRIFFTFLIFTLNIGLLFSEPITLRKISESEKEQMKEIIFEEYAGKYNLSEEEFEEVETIRELVEYFNTFIKNDAHFEYGIIKNGVREFRHKPVKVCSVENPIKSEDKELERTYKTSKNCEYLRLNTEVRHDEPILDSVLGNKEYLIFDTRGNAGGYCYPMEKMLQRLSDKNSKAKIIVLQDRNSGSSGEIWNWKYKYPKLNFYKLLGQNSRGICQFTRNSYFYFGDFFFFVGREELQKDENWLGELNGFSPDIWVDSIPEFSSCLSSLGVELDGIVIK